MSFEADEYFTLTANSNLIFKGYESGIIDLPDQSAVSVTLGSNQAFSAVTFQEVQFNTEQRDIHGEYDNSITWQFKPVEAGWYLFSTHLRIVQTWSAGNRVTAHFYKNGTSLYDIDDKYIHTGANYGIEMNGTALIYMDGGSDYVRIKVWTNQSGGATVIGGDISYASMVKVV